MDMVRALRYQSDAAVGEAWMQICKVAAEIVSAMDLLEYTPYLDDVGSPIPRRNSVISCTPPARTRKLGLLIKLGAKAPTPHATLMMMMKGMPMRRARAPPTSTRKA